MPHSTLEPSEGVGHSRSNKPGVQLEKKRKPKNGPVLRTSGRCAPPRVRRCQMVAPPRRAWTRRPPGAGSEEPPTVAGAAGAAAAGTAAHCTARGAAARRNNGRRNRSGGRRNTGRGRRRQRRQRRRRGGRNRLALAARGGSRELGAGLERWWEGRVQAWDGRVGLGRSSWRSCACGRGGFGGHPSGERWRGREQRAGAGCAGDGQEGESAGVKRRGESDFGSRRCEQESGGG